MPFLASFNCWQNVVVDVAVGGVRRKRPRESVSQIAHDFPVCEQGLTLFRIGQFKGRSQSRFVSSAGTIWTPSPAYSSPSQGLATNRDEPFGIRTIIDPGQTAIEFHVNKSDAFHSFPKLQA